MIDVSGLELSLDAALPENHEQALQEIAKQLDVSPSSIQDARLMKRSIDARKKSNVHFTVTYRLELKPGMEERLLARAMRKDRALKSLHIGLSRPYEPLSMPQLAKPDNPPVVVGAGPAGLFAAWYLAKCGLAPLLIEQGAPVEERAVSVETFFREGKLDPWSNIQFGEGGAGTFSDGKLTTNAKNRYTAHVLHWFVDAGAPETILWQAHPHLGSDNLASIVAAIREDVIRLGGEVRFHTQLVDLAFENGRLRAASFEDLQSGGGFDLLCDTLILACGHSARRTFQMMRDRGFAMEQKPFSMGVRIEHPQTFINKAQWGSAAQHPALGAAEYKLAVHLPSGRSVYSFCMCPGGEVVAAASEAGGIVTNGMSNYARDGENANAALLVNVDPTDFGSDDVLAGMELQRQVEQRAYAVSQSCGGAPYQAPAQTLGSFLRQSADVQIPLRSSFLSSPLQGSAAGGQAREDSTSCLPTYERGVVAAPLDEVLPSFVVTALREALPLMGKRIRGFDDSRAMLTAPETRSSSPVRICRDETLQAHFTCGEGSAEEPKEQPVRTGLYPCGEGPGFAGGIMSAAVDGLKVAQAVADAYQQRLEAPRVNKKASEASQACEEGLVGGKLSSFEQAVQTLEAGDPVVFPTDTVFGLGLAVNFSASPDALYRLKHRAKEKPIAWLVGDASDLGRYGKDVPVWAKELARRHWPGALTLVVEASDAVPAAYRSAEGTIALRMPDHEVALSLIRRVGPIATTSANLSGCPAPARLDDVPEELVDEVCSLAGSTHDGQASSVVDCTKATPQVIRAGTVDAQAFLAGRASQGS